MGSLPLVKVSARTAAEVCAHVYLQKQALKLLRPEMGPREFIEALLNSRQYAAAIDFVAHALPAREAIWWGCLCMQHVYGGRLSLSERAAGIAAVRWVLEPSEENRVAAKPPAEAAGAGSPAGSLAMAVNMTGGSLGPPDAPPVPPGPHDPANRVATAIKLTSTKAKPDRIPDTQRSFVALGVEVAEGKIL